MRDGRLIRVLLVLAGVGMLALASGGAAVGERDGEAAKGPSRPSQNRLQQRPNVVVLMTDDQTVESLRVMRNVNRMLARPGATLTQSVVSFALCCPSRATFLTGQYAHNHRVLSNVAPRGGYGRLDHSTTLPVWLRRGGYYTVHVGKHLNGYGLTRPREVPPGWSEWYGAVDPSTYRYWGFTMNENRRLVRYSRRTAYQTDVFARRAAEVIARRAPRRQPFFLYVGFVAPHSGGPRELDDPPSLKTPAPAPRHRDRFLFEPLPTPPSFNEQDVQDKPLTVRRRPGLQEFQLGALTEAYQQQLESLLAVDEAVARIVNALKRADDLEKTLIIFTSDNGYFHGEHRIPSGKVFVYEPATRVPLIVRGPRIPPGQRIDDLVANIDLAPTIADAANVTPLRIVDGRSLLPLLERGIRPATPRSILIESPPSDVPRQVFTAVRTPQYLYAAYESGDQELYDLYADPYQLASQHRDPGQAALVAELSLRLEQLRTCAGVNCRRIPTSAPAPRPPAGESTAASTGSRSVGDAPPARAP
jgi:N-acetylglucosamine-6-sulfatase